MGVLEWINVLFIVLAIISIVVFSIAKTTYDDKHISFRESLALTDLPIITFNQGSKKLNFMLDTGANLSIIDKEVAQELETIPTEKTAKITGIDSKLEGIPIISMQFTYKENTFVAEFQVVDMSKTFQTIKNATGVTIHGLIGNTFMQRYKYVLDFDKMVAYSKKRWKKKNKK